MNGFFPWGLICGVVCLLAYVVGGVALGWLSLESIVKRLYAAFAHEGIAP